MPKKNKLKTIDEAWLGLDIPDKAIFDISPFLNSEEEDYHLRLTWLMTQPEYFSFLCKQVLNVQLLFSMRCGIENSQS